MIAHMNAGTCAGTWICILYRYFCIAATLQVLQVPMYCSAASYVVKGFLHALHYTRVSLCCSLSTCCCIVTTISRPLKFVGLFCKRALQKQGSLRKRPIYLGSLLIVSATSYVVKGFLHMWLRSFFIHPSGFTLFVEGLLCLVQTVWHLSWI